MKLKSSFVIHKTDDSYLMVSVGKDFNGMIRSNPTGGAMIDLLKEGLSREQIVERITAQYDVDPQTVSRDLDTVIETLRSIGAIDE